MDIIIILIHWQMYSSIIANIRVSEIKIFWQNLWFLILFKK